jgi:hypothetical protein
MFAIIPPFKNVSIADTCWESSNIILLLKTPVLRGSEILGSACNIANKRAKVNLAASGIEDSCQLYKMIAIQRLPQQGTLNRQN